MKRVFFLTILLVLQLLFISKISAQVDSIVSGEDLIRLIYNKYSKTWYPHITFKQEMYRYRNDTLFTTEVWQEAYSAPSKLHIRYQDFDTGRGWLIVNDTLYSFNHKKLIGKNPRKHPLLLLGFDIYIVPPEDVIPRINALDIDITKLSTVTKNGRLLFQVGDPEKQCFWVDKNSLLFYGTIRITESGSKEYIFDGYRMIYDKPVATEIQSFENGHLVLFEKYYDIRLPSSLPAEFFDPANFETTRW